MSTGARFPKYCVGTVHCEACHYPIPLPAWPDHGSTCPARNRPSMLERLRERRARRRKAARRRHA